MTRRQYFGRLAPMARECSWRVPIGVTTLDGLPGDVSKVGPIGSRLRATVEIVAATMGNFRLLRLNL